MSSPEEFRFESSLFAVWLEFRIRSLEMRVGCTKRLSILPSNSESVNNFHIHFLSILWGVTDVSSIQISLEDASRLPCHVKVLIFTVALMPFLSGFSSAQGGNRLQRHANTEITDLRPCLKFTKCLQWGCLRHDHTISVFYFPVYSSQPRWYLWNGFASFLWSCEPIT